MKNGIVFTFCANQKGVKKQKLLVENKELKRWIRDQSRKREADQIVQPAPISTELEGLVNMKEETDGLIPEEWFIHDYDENTLLEIMAEQKKIVTALKKHGKSLTLANRMLIVFDDLVGSTLFSNSRHNAFKKLNATHRHFSASLLMVTQAYKEIPKLVRTNFSALIIFEIVNEKEIEVIYEENPMKLKRDVWDQVYSFATEGDHDFLFINYQKTKRLRLMKNFQHVLYFKEDKDEE